MTKNLPNWRGVFVIVTTPFDDQLNLDIDGLRRTVRFCLDAGVHGLVATANASEVAYLSESERRLVAETVIEEAAGKVPTIVGISSPGRTIAVELARHAQSIGADALMSMPPTVQKPSEGEIVDYYQAISDASGLPMFLQNWGGPGGTTMSPVLMARLLREIGNVRFLKEETEFSSVVMTETARLAGDSLEGTMGGKAGIRLLDEYRRGACGTMPACEVSDVHVALWNALEAGDTVRAKQIYRLLLPLLTFEMGYGPAIYKAVLRKRGVIASGRFRQTGGRVLDELANVELDDILADLAPLMHADYQPAT